MGDGAYRRRSTLVISVAAVFTFLFIEMLIRSSRSAPAAPIELPSEPSPTLRMTTLVDELTHLRIELCTHFRLL